jgi:hypothetical protein
MSFFGSLLRGIGGAVGGFLTGGPVGAVTGGVRGIIGGGVPSAAALPTASPMFRTPISGMSLTGTAVGIPRFMSPATPSGGGGGGGASFLPHYACAPGMHHKKPQTKAEKSAWFASKCVTNRHMNVANVRALRRSIRRLTGFETMARRVLRITSPRPVHVGFKRVRRRKR